MIRRSPRALPSLSKKLVKVEFIGGSAQNGKICFGYVQDAKGLTVCPAPTYQLATAVSARNLYMAKWHPAFGCVAFGFTNGAFIAWDRLNDKIYSLVRLVSGEPFTAEARNENGEPLLIAVSGNQMGVRNGVTNQTTKITLPLQLCGGTVHCGRLFAVDMDDRYKVVWSGLRVTDWNDGVQGSGYVLLDSDAGKVLSIENFGDDLLCVRERGFTVMHAMADSRNFRIAPSQSVVCTGGNIGVGGVLGQKYYFASDGGLYCYDGSYIELVYAVNDVFTKCTKVYVPGDGYVYADCEYNDIKCIMRYNVQSKAAVFFGENCSTLFTEGGNLYCVKDSSFYRLSPGSVEANRLWRSVKVDIFGRQVLKTLWVRANGNIYLAVNSGGESRTFQGNGRIAVNMPGEDFTVEVSGHGRVERLIAEFEVSK